MNIMLAMNNDNNNDNDNDNNDNDNRIANILLYYSDRE